MRSAVYWNVHVYIQWMHQIYVFTQHFFSNSIHLVQSSKKCPDTTVSSPLKMNLSIVYIGSYPPLTLMGVCTFSFLMPWVGIDGFKYMHKYVLPQSTC